MVSPIKSIKFLNNLLGYSITNVEIFIVTTFQLHSGGVYKWTTRNEIVCTKMYIFRTIYFLFLQILGEGMAGDNYAHKGP